MASTGGTIASRIPRGPRRLPVASEPMSRSYIVRTYGCQMNEHDSERISGLLEADGLVPRRQRSRRRRCRAQHVLYPRERRQQALRQPRTSQDLEGRTRGAPDRRFRLPRPEGPGPRRHAGGSRRRRHGHPQRSSCGRTAGRGPHRRAPDHRDPHRGRHRRPGAVPLGAPGTPRDVVQRVGHHPDRLRQQLCVLHRARGARGRDQPALRRDPRRGCGVER